MTRRLLRRLACLAALSPLLHGPAGATRPEDADQETVWDQIMAAQAARELRSGAEYMEGKRYDLAAREFAKAVVASPKDPSAHMMLGAAYYWSGQVDQAASEFRQALLLDPKNAQGHLLLGIARAWKGDAKSAYSEFLEAEQYAPERADVQMDLGSIEETLGLFDSALDHLRKAAALDPDNAVYHYQLGMLYRHLGRDADVAGSMKTALKKSPEFEDALIELAAALDRQGDTQGAQGMFRKAVRLKPRDAVARLRLGREYLLNGNPAKARDSFREAFHLTPDTGLGLALSASFGGVPKEAGPSAPPPSQPPESVEPKDPLDMLARNLERVPLDQDAKLSVEMIFMPRPRLVRARSGEAPSELKRALERAGKPPPGAPMGVRRDFSLPAGSAAERRSRIEKALADLRETAKQAPQDSDVRLAMNLSFVPKPAPSGSGEAGGASDARNPPKASFNPHDVGNDMGLWVMGTGWIALVEEALPLAGEEPNHPDDPTWWVTDGLGYATVGKGAQALAAFDRALALDPKDELALLGRAVAFVELGEENSAVATYRRLLDLHPKNRAAKEGLRWLLKAPAK